MTTSEKAAKILLTVDAITLSPKKPYKYASGILSPVYTDCRKLISFPSERKQIRDLYVQAIEDSGVEFDVVGGTATAGIPHAAWIAEKLNAPMIYIRGKAKDHGKGNQIEGNLSKGQRVIIIEDLISTGESSIESAVAVRNNGAKVAGVFSIATYSMKKAAGNYKANKLKNYSLTTLSDILDMAIKMGKIKNEEKEQVLQWAKDPSGWGKAMGFE